MTWNSILLLYRCIFLTVMDNRHSWCKAKFIYVLISNVSTMLSDSRDISGKHQIYYQHLTIVSSPLSPFFITVSNDTGRNSSQPKAVKKFLYCLSPFAVYKAKTLYFSLPHLQLIHSTVRTNQLNGRGARPLKTIMQPPCTQSSAFTHSLSTQSHNVQWS